MTLESLFINARSAFTVVSFLTFVGIMWWAYSARRTADFEAAANLPFADDGDDLNSRATEKHNG